MDGVRGSNPHKRLYEGKPSKYYIGTLRVELHYFSPLA